MNLLRNLPLGGLPEELTEVLVDRNLVRIERIVSTGQSSPPGFWYDQAEREWVLLLQGEATLRVEKPWCGLSVDREPGPDGLLHLQPGDYVEIPAHHKHRVESTSPDQVTVWLAIFYK